MLWCISLKCKLVSDPCHPNGTSPVNRDDEGRKGGGMVQISRKTMCKTASKSTKLYVNILISSTFNYIFSAHFLILPRHNGRLKNFHCKQFGLLIHFMNFVGIHWSPIPTFIRLLWTLDRHYYFFIFLLLPPLTLSTSLPYSPPTPFFSYNIVRCNQMKCYIPAIWIYLVDTHERIKNRLDGNREVKHLLPTNECASLLVAKGDKSAREVGTQKPQNSNERNFYRLPWMATKRVEILPAMLACVRLCASEKHQTTIWHGGKCYRCDLSHHETVRPPAVASKQKNGTLSNVDTIELKSIRFFLLIEQVL